MARQSSGRRTTHQLRRYLIDVRDWTRRGMVEPHAQSTEVCYPRRDGSIGDGVIGLAWTQCSLGGSRAWFLCPQCERRVAILYHADVLACRHCCSLTYRSQRETSLDRTFRRADRLRARLKWPTGVMHGIFGRPKGMHHKTFRRLLVTYTRLQLALLRGMDAQHRSFCAQFGGVSDFLCVRRSETFPRCWLPKVPLDRRRAARWESRWSF